MTPFELDILLHYYTRIGDHPVVAANPLIWPETREDFLREELLARTTEGSYSAYVITDRARAYIKAVLALPLPVKQWVMP